MSRSLPKPCVALITDRTVCGGTERLEWAVEAAVAGGVHLVQLREKDLGAGPLLSLALRLRRITEGKALFFVNDRLDVALACGADGVQLGEESLPVEQARSLLAGRALLIGRSVHDLTGARLAAEAGADFLQIGTIFESASHPGQRPVGVEMVHAIASAVNVPVLGVGGITAGNATEVMEAGAIGVAVIREVLAASSPYQAALRLRQAVDQAYAAQQRASSRQGTAS